MQAVSNNNASDEEDKESSCEDVKTAVMIASDQMEEATSDVDACFEMANGVGGDDVGGDGVGGVGGDGVFLPSSVEASTSQLLQAPHYAVIDGMVDIVVKKIRRKHRRKYHKIVMVTDLKVERGTADGKEFQKALKQSLRDNLIKEFGELYSLVKVSIKKKKKAQNTMGEQQNGDSLCTNEP